MIENTFPHDAQANSGPFKGQSASTGLNSCRPAHQKSWLSLVLLGGALGFFGLSSTYGCGGEEDGGTAPGCSTAAECPADFDCNLGSCVPSGGGSGCANDEECVPSDNSQRGLCVAGGCVFVDIVADAGMDSDEDADTSMPPEDAGDTTDTPDVTDAGDEDTSSDTGDILTDTEDEDTTLPPDVVDMDTEQEDMGPPDLPPPNVEPFEGCMGFGCPGLRECNEDSDTCVESDLCLDTRDCDPGRACFRGACTEQSESCAQDIDCPASMFCIARYGGCEPFLCESDDDCAGPRKCSTSPGQRFCVECLESSECPGNQQCPTFGGQCSENQEGCTTNTDCTSNRMCSNGSCTDPVCQADEFAGNQSAETAAVLSGDSSFELALCPEENINGDWFSIEVPAGDSFIAWVDYDPNQGDTLEVELQSSDLTILTRVSDSNRGGFILLTPPGVSTEIQTYYVHVLSFLPATVNYTFNVQTIEGVCFDDLFEPNDLFGEATGLDFSGSDGFQANLCAGDMDWYTQRVESGQTINVTITTQNGEVPSVDLFRSNLNNFLLRDTIPQDVKVLTHQNPVAEPATDYFIRVFPNEPENNSDYLILIEVE